MSEPPLLWEKSMGPLVSHGGCEGFVRVTRKQLDSVVACMACKKQFTLRAKPAAAAKTVKKCLHGIRKYYCVWCNPNYRPRKETRCPCGKNPRMCAIHGGSYLCRCGKMKQTCFTCKDPKYICCHDGVYREKRHCRECGGSRLCPHGKRLDRCSNAECAAKQRSRKLHMASMRPDSGLPDPKKPRASFIEGRD